MSAWVYVAAGAVGGAGALGRFLLDGLVSERGGRAFPLGTLVVNLSGTLLLGLCLGVSLRGDALAIVGTGTLGSYTTFSTWMFESHRLAEDGQLGPAAVNVVLSTVVGVAAAALGRGLGELL
jgi:fluoride exporter